MNRPLFFLLSFLLVDYAAAIRCYVNLGLNSTGFTPDKVDANCTSCITVKLKKGTNAAMCHRGIPLGRECRMKAAGTACACNYDLCNADGRRFLPD
ncbi:hypothetical protein M3Y99_01666600 [Aphelenchoides fujianensis]|nr:hypothetical protein M3Y99_01666600 [Aphelenchoides fujianensis]